MDTNNKIKKCIKSYLCGIKHKLNFGLKELYLNSNKISSDGAIPFFNSLTAC